MGCVIPYYFCPQPPSGFCTHQPPLAFLIQLPANISFISGILSGEKLFAFADKLEQHYQAAKAKVEKLSQSVLAKAFRGELVPQNPKDEPAEKLLERIMEEKAKMEVELKKVQKGK